MKFKKVLVGIFLLLIAGASLLFVNWDIISKVYNTEKAVRYFDLIIIGKEYDHSDKLVKKWVTPVYIHIEGTFVPEFVSHVKKHVKLLRRLTNLEISFVEADKANFHILFGSADEIKQLFTDQISSKAKIQSIRSIKRLACIGAADHENGKIKSARFVIPNDYSISYLRRCIVENFTKTMGLAYVSTKVRDDLFYNQHLTFKLTNLAENLIIQLYNKQVLPNMSRPDALRIVRQKMKES